jgi:hypothetical protein
LAITLSRTRRVLTIGAETQIEGGEQEVEQDRTDPERHLRRPVQAHSFKAHTSGSITNSAVGAINPISHR